MFQREITPTFADTWYRVAEGRPRLSPHVHIVRQRFGRGVAYILEEPAGGTYHRMSEAAYRFAGLLDGHRTVDEAWEACAAQMGDEAPTQKECIDLIAQLDSSGLIVGDTPIWSDTLEHRQSRELGARRRKRFGNGLFACIPLINPDRWLGQTLHLYHWLFTWRGAALSAMLLIIAAWSLISNFDRFAKELSLQSLLDPTNLALLAAIFLVLRAVHELGHAMACKAMGGRCTEIGIMLIAIILPLPYCDATSSWRFPETWRRVLVAAGGVFFESFFALSAAILWARSEPGIFSSMCYNVMIVSGVSTLVFNLNPLLRYDGYYILSDIAGVPNMAQRATEMWRFLVVRFVFGVRAMKPPSVVDRPEAAFITCFALLSLPYRIMVAFAICLAVSARYSSLGLVLGAVMAIIMLVWPVLKGIAFLLWSPSLVGRRPRAVGIVAALLATIIVGFGMVPVRDRIYAAGWIRPEVNAVVRPAESGFVSEVLVQIGENVRAGQPLLRFENAEITQGYTIAQTQYARALVDRDDAATKSPVEYRSADAQVHVAAGALEKARKQADSLVLVAPADGRIIASGASGTDWANLLGGYVTKGTLLGHVVSLDRLQIRTLVDDREFGHTFAGDRAIQASIRVRGMASHVVPAKILRIAPAGSKDIQNPAVASVAGGDIPATQEGESRFAALTPHFEVDLLPDRLPEGATAGQRVRVRLAAGESPLAVQWARRFSQFWMNRFGG